MSDWLEVCSVDDLQPDSGICVKVNARQIALFYMPKEQALYALDNFDPFGQANVLSRGMIGDIGGQPMVASPLYKQHFNLATGVCFEDDTVKVATYPTRIANNRVSVCVQDAP
ncbi:MAG: nitrite reductase small subunit NirD [Methylicorpusculum sp.]|nr:nitrite reductase small subunit NirD [Methylicorpusculum sp.]MDO9239688.1 nitrite reductase small subunit NirD [Methylicorpusculum sp.]MDP2179697.1 nitrite reductase small subunit NirD [Methylicorpusculum sp.]MDP2203873.1 nitrite reductase small subunit NirD [Methylicorpusculum sp.]MDP3530918.1 nitrite reductase small subunit NirD [Methylicorpusculum sp.]